MSRYTDARERILSKVPSDWRRLVYPSFARGPEDEAVPYDVYGYNVEKCSHLLVVVSGTHGLEAPAGIFVQEEFLNRGLWDELPASAGIMFILTLNPWGYAHGRRSDHLNIDLNRAGGTMGSFVTSEAYKEARDILEPHFMNRKLFETIEIFARDPVFLKSIGGQYQFPKGLFYGGKAPGECEALRVLADVARRFMSTKQSVVMLDIHTGLGEFGEATIISQATAPDEIQRVRNMFGNQAVFPLAHANTGVTVLKKTDIGSFLQRQLSQGDKRLMYVALEMGTVSPEETLPYLVTENLLYHHPEAQSEYSLSSVRNHLLRHAFYMEDSEMWKGALWCQARQAMKSIIKEFTPS